MEPPRRRGKVLGVELHAPANGITPAWAGKRPWMPSGSSSSRDHPRVGGEKSRVMVLPSCRMGSPPRRRGKVKHVLHAVLDVGITPAWAGKSGRSCGQTSASRDHPRVGGEKVHIISLILARVGSPPRRRGKDKAEHLVQDHIGITPAQAGKSSARFPHRTSARDHPRIGGEKCTQPRPAPTVTGSPPHRRGKDVTSAQAQSQVGITPAWAGKRRLAS